MSKQKPILSIPPKPYLQERNEFISKVTKLAKECGYNQLFFAVSTPQDNETDLWYFHATADFEKLVEFLQDNVIPDLENDDYLSPPYH